MYLRHLQCRGVQTTWWAPTVLVAGSLYEIAASSKRNKAPKIRTTSNSKVEHIDDTFHS